MCSCDSNRSRILISEFTLAVQRQNSNVGEGSVSCATFNCIKWKTYVHSIGQEFIQNRHRFQWNAQGICLCSESGILQRQKWMDRLLWCMYRNQYVTLPIRRIYWFCFFPQNSLFYKKISKRSNETMLVVNTETLSISCKSTKAENVLLNHTNIIVLFILVSATIQIAMPSNKDGQNCILFSDEDSLNAICSLKDVCIRHTKYLFCFWL